MSNNRESEWYDKLDAMEQDAMTFHLRPDPKPISKGVQRVLLQPDRVGWAKISDNIRKYDEEKVSDVKEDIDVLLVLAGLFSAVMTSFVLDSYSRLQQIRNGPTNAFFAQMSLQLLHINRMAGLVDPSLELPSLPPPQIDPMSPISATRINLLWSSSLVLSLLTASFGMFIKQWINAYMSLENRSPMIQLRVRFFRNDGLATYKVWEIAAILPILLQAAFLLFLIGFAEFILQNNLILGWIVVAMMITWLFAVIITTIIPFVSSQCPYKSPLWKSFVRNARHYIWDISEHTHMHLPFDWHFHLTGNRSTTEEDEKKAAIPTPESITPPANPTPSEMEKGDNKKDDSLQISNKEQSNNKEDDSRQNSTWSRFRHRLGLLVGHFEEDMIRTSSSSDIAILARAQSLLLDQELADHIRRCAEAITLVEATEYMKARLRVSPFKRDCEAMKLNTSNRITPKDRRWHVSFPRKANHLLYEILSYTLDAHFKFNFKNEIVTWDKLVPHPDSLSNELADVDASLKAYAQSLGRFWKFRVVYESLTYVTFFACHSRMTHSSAIWRALQGDVVHFSWLAQSFPHIAINFIHAVAAPTTKFTDIHDQLRERTDEFRKKQEGKKGDDRRDAQAKGNQQDTLVGEGQEDIQVEKAGRDIVQENNSNQESRRRGVHFVSEIPGDQEVLYREPDNEPMNVDYIKQLIKLYQLFCDTRDQTSTPGDKLTLSQGNETSIPGNETPAPGNETSTPGNKTPALGDKIPTSGHETLTPGNKAPTTGNETPTPGNETSTPGNETSIARNEPPTSGNEASTLSNDWNLASDALEDCFNQYGWTSMTDRTKLRICYVFLILLRLVPANLIDRVETQPQLSTIFKEIRAEIDRSKVPQPKDSNPKESETKDLETKEPETKEPEIKEPETEKPETKDPRTEGSKPKDAKSKDSKSKEPQDYFMDAVENAFQPFKKFMGNQPSH